MGLCMAAQKGPFVMKYYVVLSPIAPEHPSVLPQGRGAETDRKMEKRKRVESKNIRREKHTKNERNSHVMLTVVKGREI